LRFTIAVSRFTIADCRFTIAEKKSKSKKECPMLKFRIFFVLMLSCAATATAQPDVSTLQTRAEASNFEQTSRYREVVDFMQAVAAASDQIRLTHFGYTTEGRALPLAVVGNVADVSPKAVRAAGKTVIYVQGDIHAGEVCGKEALLILLRQLAQGKHAEWADSLVLLLAPIYNADGNERISLYNRRRQNGPIGGMGQRANARGYDLNRDHMKLDTPEARSLVRLLRQYDPHLVVDLHTTDGTYHAYHLTYALPMNPNTFAPLVDFLHDGLLPAVTRAVRDKHGWEMYYYGNLPWRGMQAERAWYTYGHEGRYNTNYIGLRNRLGILSEAYAYASFEERIRASLYFVEEIANYAYRHASEIRRLAAQADAASVVGQKLALRAKMQRSEKPVQILLGEVEKKKNPYSGELILERKDVRKPEMLHEYERFVATETEIAPKAYIIPSDLKIAIDRIEAHGIRYRVLETSQTLPVQKFRIDSVHTAEREYQQHKAQTLFGAYESHTETLPAGTILVPVDQPLGRLVFYLLEPRSDDGLVQWGLLHKELEEAKFYPIWRRVQ